MIDRILMSLLAVAIVFAIGALGYRHGVDTADTRWKAKYNADLAVADKAVATMQEAARLTEAKHAADMAAIDTKYTKELSDAKTVSDRAIADLRAGTLRVRDSLACPAARAGEAGKAGAGTSVGDATASRGLQPADAELVLRIAGEADAVAVQLGACQGIVRGDRDEGAR